MRRFLIVLALGTALLPAASRAQSTTPDVSTHGLEVRQHAHLQASRELLDLTARPWPDGLTKAVALAKAGTVAQGRALRVGGVVSPITPPSASPAQAAQALAALTGVAVAPEQLARLEAISGPARGALTRLIDAFASMQSSAGTTIDLAGSFAARNRMLDAALALRDAIVPGAASTGAACSPIAAPPAFSIDLGTCDDTYTADVALLVDAGGNDRYLNNAGGSDLLARTCQTLDLFPLEPPSLPVLPSLGVAALIDLAGDDRYGDATHRRECGANGGGFNGSGFLLDAAGNDTYTARGRGTNGGANASFPSPYSSGVGGVGFLLDAGGNDTYTAESLGTNGGGWGSSCVGCLLGEAAAVGFLLDVGGSDTYAAGSGGTNGGGVSVGTGFLLDTAGSDIYSAGGTGTNGGGVVGAGFLLDAAGSDVYATSGGGGTNGGGFLGTGLLLDAAGSDTYLDPRGADADCTIAPKGQVGAQIDLPSTTC